MIKIGLTGPTGAGKSTVAAHFAAAGIPIVDADKAARQVTAPGSPTLAVLADAFGEDVLSADGILDRAVLAARAFSTPENTEKLNAITHPAILEVMKKELDALEAAGEKAAVIDAPLLFEANLDSVCDLTVAVLASKEVRLVRILSRDEITEQAALRRMAAQPDEQFYLERAGNILYNDDDEENLEKQTAVLLKEIGRWCE